MSRVLFAHGHLLRFDRKQLAIGKPYPPLATITAAAYLRTLGHQVALFDPTLDEDTTRFAEALANARPDIVVLYDDVFNWFTKMCLGKMREAALRMIRQARAAGARVVVSGHDAADAPSVYLAAGADFVVVGEGEITLGELVTRIDGAGGARSGDGARSAGPVVDDIPGLVWKHLGLERRTGPRALLKDLDVLPMAAWDLVDVARYRAFWIERHGMFSLNVATTRGCPYLCNWCAKPVYGNTYHTRSPEGVAAEIAFLRRSYQPDHLWFCDDIFGLKTRWLIPFADLVAGAGRALDPGSRPPAPLPFLCQTRADLMNDEHVTALRRAGCAEAWLGVESGSQAILNAMDKGIKLEQVRGAVSRLRAAGIRVGFFLQFGYPGEGWPEIEDTRRLVRELAPDEIGISVSYPLPGTVFHERVKARLGDKRNWDESADLDPLFPGAFSREFYRVLSRTVHAEFRTRRAWRAVQLLARDPVPLGVSKLARTVGGFSELPIWLAGRAHLGWQRLRGLGNPPLT